MKHTIKEIYNLLREREKNTIIALLRGECNDVAKGYLLGSKEAYHEILSLIEPYIVK